MASSGGVKLTNYHHQGSSEEDIGQLNPVFTLGGEPETPRGKDSFNVSREPAISQEKLSGSLIYAQQCKYIDQWPMSHSLGE